MTKARKAFTCKLFLPHQGPQNKNKFSSRIFTCLRVYPPHLALEHHLLLLPWTLIQLCTFSPSLCVSWPDVNLTSSWFGAPILITMTMLFLLNSMVVLGDSVLFHIEHLLLQPPSQEPPIRVQVRGQMTWVELSNDKSTFKHPLKIERTNISSKNSTRDQTKWKIPCQGPDFIGRPEQGSHPSGSEEEFVTATQLKWYLS